MTDPEDFLSRWSRRKRDAKAESAAQTKHDGTSAPDQGKPQEPLPPKVVRDGAVAPEGAAGAGENPKAMFDLSTLPSLDSIGPATDISVFLQAGVPEALSRAALRRAWSADPGIRDFIGLSENSWDFTAGDGMHGFGALDPADAKRLLAQLFSEGDETKDTTADDATTPEARRVAEIDTELASNDSSDAASMDGDAAATGSGEPEAVDDIAMLQSSNPAPDPIAPTTKADTGGAARIAGASLSWPRLAGIVSRWVTTACGP